MKLSRLWRSSVVAGVSLAALVACKKEPAPPPAAAPPAPAPLAVAPEAPKHELPKPAALAAGLRAVALPGAAADVPVGMDYLAYDPARHRVWVPAGNTGSVDVIDTRDDKLTRIDGFPTREMERNGRKRTVGPSSAAVGGDVVYVGNRGDSSVCAFDATSLARLSCVTLDSMPDGLQVVASLKELWVTTPRDQQIQILDVSSAKALELKEKLKLEGDPEGFAVDDKRGVFYTNLEDKDRTLAIDLKTRKTTHTWEPKCGDDGPKGLALDHALDFLIVACPEHVIVLDAGHDGKPLGSVDTGDGIDAIDYVEARHELFAAAARAAKLTVATLDQSGALPEKSSVATSPGARNAVATEAGVAYVADTPGARIIVVPGAAK